MDREALSSKVNDRIKNGWEPIGGVAMAQEYTDGKPSGQTIFAQAMLTKRA
jgi:Domain of unknown function (DUF1737)